MYKMLNDNFMVTLLKIVDKYAPIKQKYIRLNQGPFITKRIRKEIMKRSRLRNIYLRDSSPVAKQAYNKQRNLCCSLIKESKKDYYSKLNPSLITSARKRYSQIETYWKYALARVSQYMDLLRINHKFVHSIPIWLLPISMDIS